MKGFDFIVAVIGLFGIGEILLTMEEGLAFRGAKARINPRVVWQTWKILPRYYRTFVRSAFIGFWMGFKPGGATPASFMSYAFAKRFSKQPGALRQGRDRGRDRPGDGRARRGRRRAPADDHAGHSRARRPPPSCWAASSSGASSPGRCSSRSGPDFVWGLIASMYTGNVIGVIMVLAFVPLFAAILRMPFAILTPLIVCVCAIGAYSVHNSMIDIWYMLIFGVIGYVFKKLDYPLAPLVLALVLGDLAENALRQSLIMSQGSLVDLRHAADLGRHHRWPPCSSSRCRWSPRIAAACGGRRCPRPPDRPRTADGGAVNADFVLGVLKIVLIDLALAGDNALVIALAVRTLPKRQQFLGRIWGTVGAVGLRLLFIAIITYLLAIPLLQVVGGLLLIWIAVKLVRQTDSPRRGARAPRHHAPRGDLDHPRGRRGHEPRQRDRGGGRRRGRHAARGVRHRAVHPHRGVGQRHPRQPDESLPVDHPHRCGHPRTRSPAR